MGRPFYPQEADDPDLDWLISNFLYENPDYVPVEVGMLPLVLIPFREPPSDLDGNVKELEDLEDLINEQER